MSVTSSHSSRVASMASGTLVSRLTGLLRVLVLAWVLGFTPLADSFNLANTVPNMLFDLVLGGIASATFIPVFVERLALDGERRAWKSISSVITAAVLVLLGATILSWFIAPYIIDGFTFLQRSSSHSSLTVVAQQRTVATDLLRFFVPQIFFYGIIGIATALLNIRRRFGIATWVPIANNVVCIAVLIWFHLVDPSPILGALNGSRDLLWLGLGTTAGVAVQFLCLVPSLLRSDLWRLSFRLDLKDKAVRTIGRLGSWTLLVVLANQLSLYVVLAYAFGLGGNGPVSAYTYGWSFMQMPYAVVVVSVLGAITPQLAGFATDEDYVGLSERLRFGLRQSLVIIIPCTLVLIVLSQPLVAILLNHVNATRHLAVGTVLAVLAAGLPGFTIFQLCVRGLQSMQRAREVFLLYVLDNALTIVLCVVLGRHSIAGLTASVSIGYTVAAVAALIVLARYQVNIITGVWSVHVRRSLVASLVATAVIAVVYAVPTWTRGYLLVTRFGAAVIAGVIAYGLVVVAMRRRVRRAHAKSARLDQF
ncbi:MAG TPA: murein biosynthesis integral membrane protein MurJ [Acidimicrobiales bacterium]|nr:murein biosynthesis integral membrane protein MurJ [Acidimicrobiales bacterium]